MATTLRRISARRPGSCCACGGAIAKGDAALWDSAAKRLTCMECRPGNQELGAQSSDELMPVIGQAGASAAAEAARRRANRRKQIETAHPRLGKVVLAVSDEPHSVAAWDIGAAGERRVGDILNARTGYDFIAIHDRRIPGHRTNIDHIAVTRNGVFVIDAKRYQGRVELRDFGWLFRHDYRLFVGGRDRMKLADGVVNQARVVREVLDRGGRPDVPVVPILCFVGSDWPLFAVPLRVGGVHVVWPKKLLWLMDEMEHPEPIEPLLVRPVARLLRDALPEA